MKKILSTLVLLLVVSVSFSQIVIGDSQLFGSSRAATPAKILDAGLITDSTYTHEFTIKNSELVDIQLSAAVLPQGVSVMFPRATVSPDESGRIIVTVYKNYLSELDDDNNFTVKLEILVAKPTIGDQFTHERVPLYIKGQFE